MSCWICICRINLSTKKIETKEIHANRLAGNANAATSRPLSPICGTLKKIFSWYTCEMYRRSIREKKASIRLQRYFSDRKISKKTRNSCIPINDAKDRLERKSRSYGKKKQSERNKRSIPRLLLSFTPLLASVPLNLPLVFLFSWKNTRSWENEGTVSGIQIYLCIWLNIDI